MNHPLTLRLDALSSTLRFGLHLALLAGLSTPALAIAGKGAKLEFAIDAPWRLEPTTDAAGNVSYGSIPVQISIHDALLSSLDEKIQMLEGWVSDHHVGRFVELTIQQVTRQPGGSTLTYPLRRFALLDLDVIERTTGVWQVDVNDSCLDPPRTEVCEVWKDPGCAAAAAWLEGTSEWHATLLYAPQGALVPGATVHLLATVTLTREHARFDPPFQGFVREVILHDLEDPDYVEDPAKLVRLVNEVAVRLGDAPLPRFGRDWLYGDLHYHSQGTDNEGESAYNYRGVLEAMGALGIDFVFATEHASDSRQFVDGDTSVGIPPVHEAACGLRDMSPGRFALLHGALHGTPERPNGANREVMSRPDGRLPQTYLSHGGVPQVFLGGEVDVIPEIGAAELIVPREPEVNPQTGLTMAEGHALAFGDGLRHELSNLCGGAITQLPGGLCYLDRVLEPFEDTYLVKDLQGFNDWYHARQHLIYLPGRQDDPGAFVGSRTEKYGGGSRLLFRGYEGQSPVVPEIEAKGGWFFIAHPLDSAGKGAPGPDLVPYSEHQLRALLRSPAFLGLQFWNEDTRLYSEAMDAPPPMSNRGEALGTTDFITEPDGKDGFAWDDGLFTLSTNDDGAWNPQWHESRGSTLEGKLYHAAYTWDRMLLWGLGARVHFTRGCEPRKVLMAGGSDAHGDFNYRRVGYFHGTDGIVDTAIAKPRNLVHVGPASGKPIPFEFQNQAAAAPLDGRAQPASGYVPHSQEQIIDALRSGEFCVTDGPALRIAIGETPMGGVHYLEGSRLTIEVEWKSTPEFGPLDEVHVYIGAGSSASCAWEDRNCAEVGLVYAPRDAGPRNQGDETYPTPGPYSSGPPFTIYRINERLRIDAASEGHPLGYEGMATVSLGNGDLRLANLEVADRYFVRAVARTATGGCGERASLLSERCQPRFAFTNPIWVVPGSLAAPQVPLFRRGDANGDGRLDVSDALATLAHLFLGGITLGCDQAADADDNDRLEIADAVRVLTHLFLGAAPPAPPHPDCGVDPTVRKGSLGCRDAGACGVRSQPGPALACLPDLAIVGFEKLGELEIGPRTGFTQVFGVTVENRGSKPSGPCKITFNHGTRTADFASLEPGTSRGVRVEVRFPDEDMGEVIHLRATVDGRADVEEADEDNNRSAAVDVDLPDHCELDGDPADDDSIRFCWDDPPPPPAKPDLVGVELRVAGKVGPPVDGRYEVKMDVTVRNAGAAAAGAFQVALFKPLVRSGNVGSPWSIAGLAAGATRTFRATAIFPEAGYRGDTVSLVAFADPTTAALPRGSIAEDDETNNGTPAITLRFP